MQSISADKIFDGHQFLEAHLAIEIDETGKIISIHLKNENTIHYEGMLMPGMINCHCHLELSHLKNELPEKTGLLGFIKNIVSKRTLFSPAFIHEKIIEAETEMIQNGIVAVGDISNGLDTLAIKNQQNIYYHTFVECFGLDENYASMIIDKAKSIKNAFEKYSNASVVLHAPYSVTEKLIEEITNESAQKISTIHNQETASENELFEYGTGAMKTFFRQAFPITPEWHATQKSSLQNYFSTFKNFKNSILVHNTFTSKEDINFTKSIDTNTFWCICPNANLYIENTLPNAALLYYENCQVVFGTDSLASNHSLNIYEEMKIIQQHFPQIPFEKLLQSITAVGAKALGIEEKFGSFEVGKKPGIVLIKNDNEISVIK
jgi:cytosine/adenosine deaminase-related metal-dependent hydrolase